MEKAIIGGCDNLFVELSIPDEIKDNIEDVKAYIASKRCEIEARKAEREKERFVIALKDFECFNPHYDLEKPIKVKKGSILLVNGGFPYDQLTTMSDNGKTLFSSSENVGYEDIYNICSANNVEIVDFRLIRNSKFMKETFLKPGAVKFPIFYWFEDYEVLPLCKQNEGKEYKMVDTFDMFGKPCGMVVKITDSDLCVFECDDCENQRLIMIIDKSDAYANVRNCNIAIYGISEKTQKLLTKFMCENNLEFSIIEETTNNAPCKMVVKDKDNEAIVPAGMPIAECEALFTEKVEKPIDNKLHKELETLVDVAQNLIKDLKPYKLEDVASEIVRVCYERFLNIKVCKNLV